MASGHLAHQHYEGGVEGDAPPSKRKRTAVRVEMPRGVAVQFRHTDTSDVQEVCVLYKWCTRGVCTVQMMYKRCVYYINDVQEVCVLYK